MAVTRTSDTQVSGPPAQMNASPAPAAAPPTPPAVLGNADRVSDHVAAVCASRDFAFQRTRALQAPDPQKAKAAAIHAYRSSISATITRLETKLETTQDPAFREEGWQPWQLENTSIAAQALRRSLSEHDPEAAARQFESFCATYTKE